VFWSRVRSALRKPPGYVVRRVGVELRHKADRFVVPGRERRFDAAALLRSLGDPSIERLWERLRGAPCPWFTGRMDPQRYEQLSPADTERIVAAAERACRQEIDLLGSGPVSLGARIDWDRDYKTGDRWPRGYFSTIDYLNPGRPSDVKTAWELSRMQWLIPAGQAYCLTGEERYAQCARSVLESWINDNPYACSVNWGVTMEPAMRIFTWLWLFTTFAASAAWSDPQFQRRYLSSLYLHAEFTERFIERSDINGNHFTADAAALVAAGAFFGRGAAPERWLAAGLRDLEREIELQVFPDGVDFEASTAYHRLVAELFLYASLWADCAGKSCSSGYRERLRAMGQFAAAYSRDDGSSPLWGDADDARTLPFGAQPAQDHRYLPTIIAHHVGDAELAAACPGPQPEIVWLYGPDAAAPAHPARAQQSRAFTAGGVYIMRNSVDHVFIDCGPVGLGGRGGHGHNDLLAFEAMLDGELLVTDSGCFVYTADFAARNRFRATSSHNTPRVDGAEINRFISPNDLWNLIPDARHEATLWNASAERDEFAGAHTGYMRLRSGVRVERYIALDHARHELTVVDRFVGAGEHEVEIPLHLAPGVTAIASGPGSVTLQTPRKQFALQWSDTAWQLQIEDASRAPSYGKLEPITRLAWSHRGAMRELSLRISPL
jgi:hypothetical protein